MPAKSSLMLRAPRGRVSKHVRPRCSQFLHSLEGRGPGIQNWCRLPLEGELGECVSFGLSEMRVFTMLPMRHWREAGPAAAAAEAAGFDAVMTVELGHDLFTPLAFAALATERIELTTSIAVAFPRSPTVMAIQAWDLNTNSNGRFVLGLGSQVKGHNERRFGIVWSPPAPRLRDYVRALRAIWQCWETGGKLDYQGEHFKLTLMTPDFSPEPTALPMVPVTIAAVGEAMLRVAGEVCDGVRLHPLCSRRYLAEIAPAIAARFGGLADSIEVNFPDGAAAGLQRELISDIRRIPHAFTGFGATT